MTVEEVMEAAGVGRNAAYQIIKKLNAELEAMGKLTFRGRVNRNFFKEKSAMIAERLDMSNKGQLHAAPCCS